MGRLHRGHLPSQRNVCSSQDSETCTSDKSGKDTAVGIGVFLAAALVGRDLVVPSGERAGLLQPSDSAQPSWSSASLELL